MHNRKLTGLLTTVLGLSLWATACLRPELLPLLGCALALAWSLRRRRSPDTREARPGTLLSQSGQLDAACCWVRLLVQSRSVDALRHAVHAVESLGLGASSALDVSLTALPSSAAAARSRAVQLELVKLREHASVQLQTRQQQLDSWRQLQREAALHRAESLRTGRFGQQLTQLIQRACALPAGHPELAALARRRDELLQALPAEELRAALGSLLELERSLEAALSTARHLGDEADLMEALEDNADRLQAWRAAQLDLLPRHSELSRRLAALESSNGKLRSLQLAKLRAHRLTGIESDLRGLLSSARTAAGKLASVNGALVTLEGARRSGLLAEPSAAELMCRLWSWRDQLHNLLPLPAAPRRLA